MNTTFDVIVIGAGVVGSGAAYQAAKSGARVLLLEQFEIDHQRGSSYGYSRIIRYAYDHPIYVDLARAAYPLWSALEAEAGERLFLKTGGLDFAPAGNPTMQAVIDTLRATGIAHEVRTPAEAMANFPQFRLDDDMTALYQADSGVLRASRCVQAQVRMAQAHGAAVIEHSPVTRITPTTDGVEIDTAQSHYSAARLIIAAGGWMGTLMRTLGIDLPLQPISAQENYFAAAPAADYEIGRFPVWIAHVGAEYGFPMYGLPSVDGSGLKIGLHGGAAFDPATPERTPQPSHIEAATRFAARYLPHVGTHQASRMCIYTMTPDEHFTIDRHPEYPQIAYSASCSGHAFKFGTLLGKFLSDLALTGTTSHDLSFFSAQRFANLAGAV